MIYGHARCSTNEDKQDINRQIRELKTVGAEEVIFEYEHGDQVKKNLNMLSFYLISVFLLNHLHHAIFFLTLTNPENKKVERQKT